MKTLLLFLFSLPCLASYLPGAVMSTTGSSLNGSSVVKLEFATFTNSGSCAISQQSGFISGVTDPGQGRCSIDFYSGIFSVTPHCVCNAFQANAGTGRGCHIYDAGVTAVVTQTYNSDTGVADDIPFTLICAGAK